MPCAPPPKCWPRVPRPRDTRAAAWADGRIPRVRYYRTIYIRPASFLQQRRTYREGVSCARRRSSTGQPPRRSDHHRRLPCAHLTAAAIRSRLSLIGGNMIAWPVGIVTRTLPSHDRQGVDQRGFFPHTPGAGYSTGATQLHRPKWGRSPILSRNRPRRKDQRALHGP